MVDLVDDLTARTSRIELPDEIEEPGDESVADLLMQDTVEADETEEESCEELVTSDVDLDD